MANNNRHSQSVAESGAMSGGTVRKIPAGQVLTMIHNRRSRGISVVGSTGNEGVHNGYHKLSPDDATVLNYYNGLIQGKAVVLILVGRGGAARLSTQEVGRLHSEAVQKIHGAKFGCIGFGSDLYGDTLDLYLSIDGGTTFAMQNNKHDFLAVGENGRRAVIVKDAGGGYSRLVIDGTVTKWVALSCPMDVLDATEDLPFLSRDIRLPDSNETVQIASGFGKDSAAVIEFVVAEKGKDVAVKLITTFPTMNGEVYIGSPVGDKTKVAYMTTGTARNKIVGRVVTAKVMKLQALLDCINMQLRGPESDDAEGLETSASISG